MRQILFRWNPLIMGANKGEMADVKEEPAPSEHTEIQWHLLKLGAGKIF